MRCSTRVGGNCVHLWCLKALFQKACQVGHALCPARVRRAAGAAACAAIPPWCMDPSLLARAKNASELNARLERPRSSWLLEWPASKRAPKPPQCPPTSARERNARSTAVHTTRPGQRRHRTSHDGAAAGHLRSPPSTRCAWPRADHDTARILRVQHSHLFTDTPHSAAETSVSPTPAEIRCTWDG